MKLIVVTDIFGYTAALPELTSQFSHLYAEICVIDLTVGENHHLNMRKKLISTSNSTVVWSD